MQRRSFLSSIVTVSALAVISPELLLADTVPEIAVPVAELAQSDLGDIYHTADYVVFGPARVVDMILGHSPDSIPEDEQPKPQCIYTASIYRSGKWEPVLQASIGPYGHYHWVAHGDMQSILVPDGEFVHLSVNNRGPGLIAYMVYKEGLRDE